MELYVKDKRRAYRKDIDGLRAVAVLSVIIFHIEESIIPGGFVGVDIFFVISGYLISLKIFQDLDAGAFSLVEFYERRVKRIVPAALVVVLVVVVISQILLRPYDAERVSESALWSLMSMANIYFWMFEDASYFATDSNQKPLLHLWSLGVEEQFYFFWPIILMATYRLGLRGFSFFIFFIIAVISFLFGEYYFVEDASFVYYMLPARAGELLVGALLAQFVVKRHYLKIPNVVLSLIGVLGFILLVQALFLLSEETVFPGFRAIPPTVGTAMIIFSGFYGDSLPNRVLRFLPLVWLGLISYSAYLWHWPILAFYRYGNFEVSVFSGVVIFGATIILAVFSYHFVEKPFRRSTSGTIRVFLCQLIMPTSMIAIFAVFSMKVDGYGFRWFSDEYKSNLEALREETRAANEYGYVCQSRFLGKEDLENEECV